MWLMQPVAQTNTRGSLAVSVDALEIAIFIQGALEVFYNFTFMTTMTAAFVNRAFFVNHTIGLLLLLWTDHIQWKNALTNTT